MTLIKARNLNLLGMCSVSKCSTFVKKLVLTTVGTNDMFSRVQQLDLSGCPQIKLAVLLLSLLPSSNDRDLLLKKTIRSPMNYEVLSTDKLQIQRALPVLLTFGAVYEVDISNCPMLCLEDAIECFSRSFPSLRLLKAAYLLHFETKKLYHLVQRCPLLRDIDFTVDISPVVSSQSTIISSHPAVLSHMPTVSYAAIPSAASLSLMSTCLPSNIAKLTLEGRIDVTGKHRFFIMGLRIHLT